MGDQIKFKGAEGNGFYNTLKDRVDAYFTENGISKHANWVMVFKTILFFGGMVGIYLTIMFAEYNAYVGMGLAAMLGLWTAFIGLNVSHDAIHGAYSSNKVVNRAIGFTFNIAGANAYMWSIMHNVVHHTFTNVPGIDEDIEPIPLIRINPDQELKKVHRFQHLYAYFFYGLTTLSWVFIKDFKKFYQARIGNYNNKNHKPIEYFNLYFFKAFYYTMFLILPMIFLPFAGWQIFLGFLINHFFCGFTLAMIFMMAHVVEGPEFPNPAEDGKLNRTWAVHQMYTTADFARNNTLLNFFVGGLNFQIEHHLFPQICHVHYRKISEIVKKTAEEFQVPYFDNPTFIGAIQSHGRLLKKFGHVERPA